MYACMHVCMHVTPYIHVYSPFMHQMYTMLGPPTRTDRKILSSPSARDTWNMKPVFVVEATFQRPAGVMSNVRRALQRRCGHSHSVGQSRRRCGHNQPVSPGADVGTASQSRR